MITDATRPATLFVFALALLAPATAASETFYVDPQGGSPGGDGSKSDPWETLEQVVADDLISTRDWNDHPYDESRTLEPKNQGAPVGAGDTLVLESGYHGSVKIEGAYNKSDITIRAASGATPKLSRLLLRATEHWVIDGLVVSPSFADTYDNQTMISVDNHGWRGPSRDVTVKNCTLYSVDDASGWSKSDWDDRAANGIAAQGKDVTIEGNVVRNSNFAISASGDRARVAGNTVDGFAGDGLRGLGDDGVFEYNVVKNAYDVNKNHDDGFQSWSNGPDGVGSGQVTGIVLRGNLFINHEDPSHPLRTSLQGIGCFDGMFVDWTIVNNVIVTDHWHGITLLGARDSRIVNNTLIDLDDSEPGPPWIKVGKHKTGTASKNVVIRNNIAPSITTSSGVTADHNIEVADPSKHFVDPAGFDLHLLETSPAVDAGSAMMAPPVDRERVPRPQGMAVDIGAYEWHAPGTLPGDAGGDAAGDVAATVDVAGSEDGGTPEEDAESSEEPRTDAAGSDLAAADARDTTPLEDQTPVSNGCTCTTPSDRSPAPSVLVVLIALFVRRRRR